MIAADAGFTDDSMFDRIKADKVRKTPSWPSSWANFSLS
jgi:hypothetical protein